MIEKKEVGDKARRDNDNTELAEDVVQPHGTPGAEETRLKPVSYTHLTLPTNREV